MEYLEEVRVLYNTDDTTILEVETNYRKYNVKLPYKVVESQKGDRYDYGVGIKDWCKIKNINYKEYFNIQREG